MISSTRHGVDLLEGCARRGVLLRVQSIAAQEGDHVRIVILRSLCLRNRGRFYSTARLDSVHKNKRSRDYERWDFGKIKKKSRKRESHHRFKITRTHLAAQNRTRRQSNGSTKRATKFLRFMADGTDPTAKRSDGVFRLGHMPKDWETAGSSGSHCMGRSS